MFSIRDIYRVNNYRAEDVTYCEIATSGEFELKLFAVDRHYNRCFSIDLQNNV